MSGSTAGYLHQGQFDYVHIARADQFILPFAKIQSCQITVFDLFFAEKCASTSWKGMSGESP